MHPTLCTKPIHFLINGALFLQFCLSVIQAQTASPHSVPPRKLPVTSWDDGDKAAISALAIETVAALKDHDGFKLRMIFDRERFLDEWLADLPLPEEIREIRRRDFSSYVVGKRGGMLGTMNLPEKVEVGFVGLRMTGGRLQARFRFVVDMMQFFYWDLDPCRSADGKLRWFDMTEIALGESELDIRRCFTYAHEAATGVFGPDALKRLTEGDIHVLQFGRWQAQDKGDNFTAHATELAKFPNSQAPIIHRYRLITDRKLQDRRLLAADLAAFTKQFPGDFSIPWHAYQEAWLRDDRKVIIERLDGIAKAYGPDPFLDAVRAALLAKDGDYRAALPLARTAATVVPEHALGHYVMAGAALAVGDYDAAAVAMRIQIDQFEMKITRRGLAKNEPAFCESEEGRRFLQTLPEM